jgi:Tfp pilus assembly protein PilV
MAFMTTTFPVAKRSRLQRRSGFTLAEVMMAATLTVVVVAGVLSSALMFTRSGYRVGQYTDMENESRKSLEQFGQDVRMAQDVAWTDANSVTLVIPTTATGTATTTCTYTYNPATQTFSRTFAGATKILLTGIDSCTMMGYKIDESQTHDPASPPASWTTVNNDTKQLQLSVSSSRSQGAQVKSAQKVISARFILRNKRVT